jgi:hypothetical protein
MTYDHLILKDNVYRESKDRITKDVERQAQEWIEKELPMRVQSGMSEKKARKALQKDTKTWIDKEIQRRLNWECQEESTEPCEE